MSRSFEIIRFVGSGFVGTPVNTVHARTDTKNLLSAKLY